MAGNRQKESELNVGHKYAVHFDLERNEIKRVKANMILDNGTLSEEGSRIYSKIKTYFENNGFDDNQKSGYETRECMKQTDVIHVMNNLFKQYPLLDSTIPGTNQKYTKSVYITKIAGSHQYIKDHDLQSINFDQKDKKCRKQIAFDLDTDAMARDGKLKSNVYTNVCNYFLRKGLIKEKQRSVYILNKSITTQDAVNILDDIRNRIPDFDKYCKECTITDVISNTDYMTYREKQKKNDPNFWPQYVTYPIISNGIKDYNFDGVPLDKKVDMRIKYRTNSRDTDDVLQKRFAAKAARAFSNKLSHNGFHRDAGGVLSSTSTTIGDTINIVNECYDEKSPTGCESLFKQKIRDVYMTVKESDILPSNLSYPNQSLSANAVKDAEELLSNINFNSDNEFENKDIK